MKLSVSIVAVVAVTTLAACAVPQHKNHSVRYEGLAMQKSTAVISRYGFDETVYRLENTFKSKGMTVFAVIDHQAAAMQHNLNMQPAKVIVFGTPKVGTPLMIKDPDFALQLPLRVLVTEAGGKVRVVFNNTNALIEASKIAYGDVENTLVKAEKLIQNTVSK